MGRALGPRATHVLISAMLLLLGVACDGCGSTKDAGRPSASPAQSHTPALAATPGVTSPRGPLEGDEDDDDRPGEKRGHLPNDPDIDGDNDTLKQHGYYDRDDREFRAWGHAAGASDRRALAALVKRYYSAAGADDGAAACSMLTPVVAKAVPQDFGRGSAGPAYLRSATTCQQVLTTLFARIHAQVSAPIEITLVRVQTNAGLVLFGSPSVPASYLEATRSGRVWRLEGMTASALP